MEGARVIVAVSPRLLGDAVCRALAQDGLAVTSQDDVAGQDVYDVAVVSPGREREVRAAHVLTVPPEASGPDGLTTLALLRGAIARLS